MKKIISVLTVCFLICTGASASPQSLISDLGISGRWDSQFFVTRGTFAAAVSEVIKITPDAGAENPFGDLEPRHEFYGQILACYKAGIISGDGSGSFRPNDPITHMQAVKMLMSAMGYDAYANVRGGYPMGYLLAAQEASLLDNFKMNSDAWLSESEGATLLYNALHSPVLEMVAVGSEMEYQISSDTTLLSRYFNMFKGEGRLYGVYGLLLSENYAVGKGEVQIGDEKYLTGNNDLRKFVGHNVEFYYRENDDGENEIVSVSSKSTEIEFSVQDIIKTDGGRIYYDGENGKTESISIVMETAVVYNGKIVDIYNPDDFKNKEGKARAVLDRGNNLIAIFFEIGRDIVVKAVDTDAKVIYDKYSMANNLVLDDDASEITFIDEYGYDMKLEELGEGDVLTVVESKDREIVHIYYSNSETKGTVTSVENDGKVLEIDGIAYETTAMFREHNSIRTGSYGLFLLNVNKKIVGVELRTGGSRFGYLLHATSGTGLAGNYEFRILREDGEIVNLSTVSVVEADGSRIYAEGEPMNPENLIKYLSDANGVVQQPIRYQTNNEGKITLIDTATKGAAEDEKSLVRGYSGNNLRYLTRTNTFAAKVPIRQTTAVFLVSPRGSVTDNMNYRAHDAGSYFANQQYYNIESFYMGDDSHIAEVIVKTLRMEARPIKSSTPISIVERISVRLNENMEEVYGLSVYTNNSLQQLEVNSNAVVESIKRIDNSSLTHNLKPGDVIRYELNEINKVATIDLVYDVERDLLRGSNPNTSSVDAQYRIQKSLVYSVAEGYVLLTPAATIDGSLGMNSLESYPASVFPIYVYDPDKAEDVVSKGGFMDIRDYKTYGEPSKVILYTTYAAPGMLYVIK